MKKLYILLVLTFAFLTSQGQRTTETINSTWRFERSDISGAENPDFNDSAWEIVNLPHTWNAKDATEVKNYYRGIGWYRKKLIATIQEGKNYFLFFEGALQDVTVYVNGKRAGSHKGGYSAFRFDVTPLLNKGDNAVNLIAVKVDNSYNPAIPPLTADFTFWGGIYRDVWLTETNPVHFRMDNAGSNGVFIETPEVSRDAASMKVRGELRNEENHPRTIRIKTVITDDQGKTLKEITSGKIKLESAKNTSFDLASGRIAPHLWSPDDPYLYRVITQILDDKTGSVLDELNNPLGFRWFSADTKNGFMLNGNPLKLVGTCRHQDYPGQGNALTNDQNRYDMEMIKKMGGNFIRIAHYPQDPSVLEACDRLGIIAWEEIPVVNQITPSEDFFNTCKTNLIEMIRQNYNHPSIVIWGYSNEVLLAGKINDTTEFRKYTDQLVSLHKQLDKICHTEDPKRMTAMAFHGSTIYNKYIADIPNIVGWNLYQGWYGSNVNGFGKFLDEQNKQYPERPLIISEYGAGSDERVHSLKPEVFDFSIEYQQFYHESYLPQILSRHYIIGSSLWNLIDFGSAGREESMPRINNKGILYYDRQPKDVYYYYQAALSHNPVLHIASRDWSDRIGTPVNASDNFVKQPVKIYSNLPEVEMYLNGNSLGQKKIDNFNTIFDVPFVNGQNILEVKGNKSKDVMIVNFKTQPFDLRNSNDKDLMIAVNAGSNCFFNDAADHIIFEPDQPYHEGSWGYIGGDFNRVRSGRPGIQNEIIGTKIDPLYQTAREGAEAYKFDVPDGRYEVELYFCEYLSENAKNTLYDLSSNQETKESQRVFNVSVNDKIVLPDFDIIRQFQPLTAVKKIFVVYAADGKGITINLKSVKGKTIINGLKIRRL